jgi:hypothetical protein
MFHGRDVQGNRASSAAWPESDCYEWGRVFSRRINRNQKTPSHSIPARNSRPTGPGPALAQYAAIAAIKNATVMRCRIAQCGVSVIVRPNV